MHSSLFIAAACLVVVAAPLAAQKPAAIEDTIRRAALTDSSQKLAAYRVVADTAWATVVDLRDHGLMDPRKGITEQEVRLERRGSSWARVSSQSVVTRLRCAGFMLSPAPPRP